MIIGFQELGLQDLDQVGGKNASLGEMINHLTKVGVNVPGGFATTADAYRAFVSQRGLQDKITALLKDLNVDDIKALTNAGKSIRQWIIDTPFLPEFEVQLKAAYEALIDGDLTASVAVRSSATAEDLPDASFAGQQETFLNVVGFEQVLLSIKEVFASLFNDRAIAYRVHHGFEHEHVALSAGVQRMVRSDKGASGVMFTLDTESGFDKVVFVTAAYGLGELVVQGAINPDEFYVHKENLKAGRPAVIRRNLGSKKERMVFSDEPNEKVRTEAVDVKEQRQYSLNDEDLTILAQQAMLIEKHYGRPMDIEWGKDGIDGKIYILQARPETVKSRQSLMVLDRYELKEKAPVKVQGRSIGQRIGQGKASVINSVSEMDNVKPGDVLVTDMTDPDWEPIMKRASAIVTNRGGRTCHAAIIARELGIPAVVGCGDATDHIKDGDNVTVSCAEGDTGYVYEGILPFQRKQLDVTSMPELPFKVMMNVGNPERAFDFQRLPNAGVGLARIEFVINQMIGVHPKALLNFDSLDPELKAAISEKTSCYDSPVDFYVSKLTEGIATLAAAFYPKPIIVRLSDFKSNEYANLMGGAQYEPHEENPMLGFRGASRYVSDEFRDCFELECRAVKHVRDVMGFTNVEVMIPFVRTTDEAEDVMQVLIDNGLVRGENGLRVIMMCEIPSNALLAEEFLEHFDGFSVGSNDLTQLTLGLDRDSGLVADHFDERNPAVKSLLKQAIKACKAKGKYIGICGQGPSDYPDFARWLMEEGIDSVSLNPDTVLETWLYLGNAERVAKAG